MKGLAKEHDTPLPGLELGPLDSEYKGSGFFSKRVNAYSSAVILHLYSLKQLINGSFSL